MLTTQRRDRRVRRQTRLVLESLHDRLVLSAGASSAAAEAVVHHPAADHSLLQQNDHDTRRREVIGHGSPATLPLNVAAGLRLLFREYKEQGGGSRFAPSPTTDRPLQIIGTRVAVLIKVAFPPALDSYVPRLRALRAGCHPHYPGLRPRRRHAADRQAAGRSAARGKSVAGSPVKPEIAPSRHASIGLLRRVTEAAPISTRPMPVAITISHSPGLFH